MSAKNYTRAMSQRRWEWLYFGAGVLACAAVSFAGASISVAVAAGWCFYAAAWLAHVLRIKCRERQQRRGAAAGPMAV